MTGIRRAWIRLCSSFALVALRARLTQRFSQRNIFGR